ncbi:hypothetical protein [Sphingomonas sp. Leaf242]|uniref:hypothetical protein n=1 Tax=Sphingomonas sp. Leaf242 TaxID=1736304 RepID=UPI0007147E79|nr:hypothetical protein [Sphingomonas sp. Leaf242]KQO06926.1 hypothetical protein ASF09_11740 [Sphingomonas sp. Leaf242]
MTDRIKKNAFPADRYEIGPVDLMPIRQALVQQETRDASDGFKPQLQFILSNQRYANCALKAINEGRVEMAHIMPIDMVTYSFEVQCTKDSVAAVRAAYDRECDALGLL